MPKHPYSSYERLPAWKVVRKALAELEQNGDVELSTASPYVIGFIIKALKEAGQLKTPGASFGNPYGVKPKTGISYQQLGKKTESAGHVSEDPPKTKKVNQGMKPGFATTKPTSRP